MFTTLLIANRGEIAARIARTARRMGMRTIAVCSDADAGALHVRACDAAVRLGPAPARDSYLRGDLIIEAARAHGAEAIHPGYGFLSENPDFADACAAAGIAFVGPRADAIRAMGLKDQAKAIAAAAGAPVLPGYWEADQGEATLAREAARIGFPLLIKAVAGGGGRGIRQVDVAEGFAAALASARREAAGAFGDDRVMLEKLVLNPRHIEVQVFGDAHGGLVHLFERDCSVQRRRQKLLEEAPAPGVDEAARAALTDAALKVAAAVAYSNAGTVEFIAEGGGPLRPDGFWFLEMNTRLQVEHPVTEAITGLDLVEWQLRVAAGEPMPLAQEQITRRGWAIEARLIAEDPDAGFLPSSGPIARLIAPAGARLDAGYAAGDTMPDAYDSLLAKLIVAGPTRQAACAALADALDRAAVLGPACNAGYLARAARHPAFVAGTFDTGFVEAHAADLARPDPADPRRVALAAAGACLAAQTAPAGPDPFSAASGWRANADPRLTYVFDVAGQAVAARVHPGPSGLTVVAEGATSVFPAGAFAACDGGWFGDEGRLSLWPRGDGVTVVQRGETYRYPAHHPEAHADAAEAQDDAKAPLPGRVALVPVTPGEAVTRGQTLAVVEAMKMEHAIPASRDGMVAEVRVSPGAQVRQGDVLVRLAPEAG